ncbi:MAG: GTPase [Clostridia bacterium]|nr:GTPase [Clostridia bacterium]
MAPKEIPVYLFTGFLESGKTTFIQDTLQDVRFNSGEKTLLLVCEEGEQEYEPENFSGHNVCIRTLDDVEELTEENLERWAKESRCERVIIEYNGMWLIQTLYDNMPRGWLPYQNMLFFDGNTFMNYNANMRSLVVDKIRDAELCVFNRLPDDADMTALHKVVRGISRRADIVYEFRDGKVVPDEIEDPLPFDLDAPVVEIEDEDFALFYRDITEDPKKYKDKTVHTKVQAVTDKRFPEGYCAMGRHIMTCCVEDIAFCPLVARIRDGMTITNTGWYMITAKIDFRFSRLYAKKGPVFLLEQIEPAEPPQQPVATFY